MVSNISRMRAFTWSSDFAARIGNTSILLWSAFQIAHIREVDLPQRAIQLSFRAIFDKCLTC